MNLDIKSIIIGICAFCILLMLKTLLDFRIAHFIVKYFYWVPLRNYFRTKPININGKWEQAWESAGSLNFQSQTDRHSHPTIRQMGTYCYCEIISKSKVYVVFGQVIDNYFVGNWYDKKDPKGYFGAFQLECINSSKMIGKWLGHSKIKHEIQGDNWTWKKLD